MYNYTHRQWDQPQSYTNKEYSNTYDLLGVECAMPGFCMSGLACAKYSSPCMGTEYESQLPE